MLILCVTEAHAPAAREPPRNSTHTYTNARICTPSSGDIQCGRRRSSSLSAIYPGRHPPDTPAAEERGLGRGRVPISFFSSINLRHGFSRTSGAAPVTMEATKNPPNWFRMNVSPKQAFACERSLVLGYAFSIFISMRERERALNASQHNMQLQLVLV